MFPLCYVTIIPHNRFSLGTASYRAFQHFGIGINGTFGIEVTGISFTWHKPIQ